VVPPFLRSVVPLLDQYKSLQKQIIGDTTLAKTRASEVAAIYRDIERWIGEAKVAAISDRSDGAFGSGASRRRQPTETATESEDEEDMEDSRRERWALIQLSEALCNRGALEPVGPRLLTVVSGSGTYPKAESFYQSRSSLFGHLSWNRFEFGTLY
jgi:ribosomal biogenesis protein LAS1